MDLDDNNILVLLAALHTAKPLQLMSPAALHQQKGKKKKRRRKKGKYN